MPSSGVNEIRRQRPTVRQQINNRPDALPSLDWSEDRSRAAPVATEIAGPDTAGQCVGEESRRVVRVWTWVKVPRHGVKKCYDLSVNGHSVYRGFVRNRTPARCSHILGKNQRLKLIFLYKVFHSFIRHAAE